ncbi:MAG: hypothetical protein V1744_05280 [Candidatus Altiarchaeota archaeon]
MSEMAHPIESTVLNKADYARLLKDLENPKHDSEVKALFDLGKKNLQLFKRNDFQLVK